MTRWLAPYLLPLTLIACGSPPVGGALTIEPQEPDTLSDLIAEVSEQAVPNNEGVEVSYTWSWAVDGQTMPDLTSPTVPADLTTKGETWTVYATPSDGKRSGVPFSASVTIGNAPPTATVTIEPDDPTTDDALEAVYSAYDPDGDQVQVAIRWSVDGQDMPSGLGPSVHAGLTERGQVWRATATPTDGSDTGPSTFAEVTIRNNPPTAPEIIITPEEPSVRNDLFCEIVTPAIDEDGDDITYTFAWLNDGLPWGGVAATTEHPGDTLPSDATEPGETWACTSTANDGVIDGPTATSPSVSISTSVPTPIGEFCGRTLPYFCGGNCTANTEAYTDNYCRMAGFEEAYSYTVHSSGTVYEVHYYNAWELGGDHALPSTCSHVYYSGSYGTAASCTCVSELICI